MARHTELRQSEGPALAGHPRGRVLVAAAALAALVAGLLVLAGPRDAERPVLPSFLVQALGDRTSTSPLVRRPVPGVTVALTDGGYAVAREEGAVALASTEEGTSGWTQYASGAARLTRHGSETIVVDESATEQFVTVTSRRGTATWRWRLDSSLLPRVAGSGWVGFLDPRTRRVSDLAIEPVKILDGRGREITPKGLRWSVATDGGERYLELRLDDRRLPTPYVIDPAVTHRASLGSNNGAGATSITLTTPAGVVQNDLLVAQISVRGGTGTTLTPPAGWTLIVRYDNTTNIGHATYYRIAGASEPGSYAWTISPSSAAAGGIMAWYGVLTSGVLGVTGANTNATNSTTVTAASITTLVNDELVAAFFADRIATTFTQATGMTERYDVSASGGASAAADTMIQVTAGATGAKTSTVTSARNTGYQVSFHVDNVFPTATQTNPGANLRGTVTIAGTATDADSGVQQVQFQQSPAGLGTWTNIGAPDTTNPYSVSFDTTTVTDGLYDFQAVSTDWAGNVTNSTAVTSRVDNTLPSSATTFPVNATWYSTAAYTAGCSTPATDDICGTGSDSGSGVASMDVRIQRSSDSQYWNGSAWQAGSIFVAATGTTSWSYTLANANLTGGVTYTVSTRATDVAGNVQTSFGSSTYSYDTAAPTTALTYPASGGAYNASTWTGSLTGTAADTGGSGLSAVDVQIQRDSDSNYWNGATWQAGATWVAATGTSSWSYAFSTANMGSGITYTVKSRATDAATNVETAPPSRSYVYDTAAPTTALTYPASGGAYNASTWTGSLTGTAADTGGSGLSAVDVQIQRDSDSNYWNGSSWQAGATWVAASGTSSWSYAFSTANMSSGITYTVKSRATDVATNVESAPPSRSYVYDTALPTSSITFPAGGAYYNAAGWTGTISGSAADTGGAGVSSVDVQVQRGSDSWYWNGSSWQAGATWLAAAGTTSWSYALAAANLTSGVSYTVTTRATDAATNVQSPTTSSSFGYDTDLPSAALSFPAAGASYNAAGWTDSLTGTAGDTGGSGLSGVEVQIQRGSDSNYWNGSSWQAGSVWVAATGTASWSYAFADTNLSNGVTHTTRARATDVAGNVTSPVASRSFTYDTAAPTVSSRTVNGATLTVAYNEVVSGSPATSNYTVVVNGSGRGVSGVSVSGTDATLTLASAVLNGDVVTVAYGGSAVVDAAGNAAATFTAQAVTNSTPNQNPSTPALVSPANAAFLATTTPTLSATFSDPDTQNTGTVNFRVCSDSGCTSVLSTFSSSAGIANGADGSAPVPGGAGLANGSTYYWQAQNEDLNAGTSAFSASRSFTVDTAAPSSAITFPAAAASYNAAGWSDSLTGTASDSGSGVGLVELSVQRASTGLWWDPAANAGLGGFASVPQLWFSATGTASWSYSFPDTKFPADGSYTVHSRATDAVGNVQSGSTSRTFTYDTVAPAVSSRGVNGATLTISYDETVSGSPATSDYTVVVNGSGRSVSGVSVSGTDATLTLASAVLNGDTVTVAYSGSAVVDAASNAAATFTAQAVTNSTPNQSPSVPALVSPANAAFLATTTPTLSATFSDPDTNNTGKVNFRVCSDSGCTSVLSTFSSSTGIANGANGSAVVPGGAGLSNGSTYYWQAQNEDLNAGTSAFSASRSFTVDTAAPTVSSRTVNGATLTVSYNETVSGSPATSDYTVVVNGSGRSVSGVSVASTDATLTLSSAVLNGDTVTVAYSGSAVVDAASNAAATFTAQAVTNSTPNQNPTVPSLVSPANAARLNTTTPTLTATFSDPDTNNTGQVNFRVCSDSGCTSVLSTFSSSSGLANGANGSAPVPGGAGLSNGTTYYWQAQNQDVNAGTSSFSSSRSFTVDTAAPTVSTRTVNGATLTISYNETVSGSPATSDYTVVVNGSGRSVSGVSVSGTDATLTLSSAVLNGDNVTVAYGGSAVVDLAGNAAATFTAQAVTNSTPNQNPSVPSLVTPANASYATTTTPTLTATFSDLDTNNTGQVNFRVCSDSGCTSVLSTFSSSTGIANGANGSASVPGGAGLANGSTYYWQAQNEDLNAGTSSFSSSRSFTVDTAAPSSAVAFPAASASYNAAGWSGTLSGTASDPESGVALVELSMQRASTGLYWDPAANAGLGGFTNLAELYFTAGGTTSWSYSFPSGKFPADGSYTLHERASDIAGNIQGSVTSVGFTYDTTAPTVSSRTVNGATLTVAYNEAVSGSPATSDYTVVVNGSGRSVSGVSVAGANATLTLASAVLNGDVVTVAYSGSAVVDAASNAAATFSAQAVTNSTANQNPSTPALVSPANAAFLNSTTPTLTATFSDPDTQNTGQVNFRVCSDSGCSSVLSTFSSSTGIANGANGSAPVPGAAGLANGSTYYWQAQNEDLNAGTSSFSSSRSFTVDTAAPTVSSRTVNGATLTIAYDETVSGSPATLDYAVVVNGLSRSVSGVSVSGTDATLTLASAVLNGDTVTVAYSGSAVVDQAGNAAATFTAQAVTNSTPNQNPTVPSLVTPANAAFLNSTTPTLTATFSDPDTQNTGKVNFRVCSDSGCSSVLSTFSSSTGIANGANGSAAVPGAAGLANGSTYYWQAQNEDANAGTSAFSSSRSFTVDTAAPTVSSRTVSGATLTVAYNEAVSGSPATSDYTAVVNGSGRSVSGVSVSGTDATLTLASAVLNGDTVTVAYGGSVVVDQAGNAAATFTASAVTNSTPNQNPSTPSLVTPPNGAYVNSTTPTLTATFSDPDTNNTGQVNFRVCSDSGCTSVLSTFSSSTGIANGANGSAPVPGGAGLSNGNTYYWQAQNEDLNAGTSSFSASRSFAVDTAAPTVSSRTVDGATLTVAYDETVSGSPATSDYTVAVNGSGRSVSGVSVSGTTATLTLSSAVVNGDTVTVAYSGSAIVDQAGNAAATFGASAVTNSTANQNPSTPALVSPANAAFLSSTTPTLTATFSDPDTNNTGQVNFRVCSDSGCSSVLSTFSSSMGIANGANGSAAVPGAAGLANGSTYYWQAQNEDLNAGTSAFSSSRSFAVDTAAPSSTVTFPAASASYNAAGWSGTLSGSASDSGSGVALVELSMQRTSTGLWWDPAANAGLGGFFNLTQLWFGATGSTSWSYSFPNSKFPADGGYTLHARASDTAGNVQGSVTSAAFTYDTAAPTVSSRTVNGATLTISYNEAVSGSPATSDYTVVVNGSGGSVSGVSVAGSDATLTLASAVLNGDTVTVAYSGSAVVDAAGNAAATFGASAVTNSTPNQNPSVPALVSPANAAFLATTTPTLTATFSDPDTNNTGKVNFRVCSDSGCTSVLSTFSSSMGIANGANGSAAVPGAAGLANGSTYYWQAQNEDLNAGTSSFSASRSFTVDTAAPTVSSRTVNGATLTVSYNEAVSGSPATSDYTVVVNGSGRGVSGVSVAGSDATLTLASAVLNGDTVTVAYSGSAVVDAAGNAAATFGASAVTNSTANQSPSVPALVSPANAAFLATTTPTLSATFSDPDTNNTGRVNFRVCSDSGCTSVLSSFSSSAGIANGADGSAAVPGAAGLANGSTYYWQAQNEDLNAGTSAFSSSRSFAVDTAAPTVSSRTVSGATLTVAYNEAVSGSPATSDYTVVVNGSGRGVSGVSVAGSDATLTLSSAVLNGDTVTVAYSGSAVVDAAGNAAATFGASAVTNSTANQNPNTPALVSPAASASLNSTTPTLSATFSDPDTNNTGRVNFRVCSDSGCTSVLSSFSSSAGIANGADGSAAVPGGAGLANGSTYYWQAQNEDANAGTSAFSASRSFTVDTAAPTVSSRTVSGATLTVAYNEAVSGSPATSDYTVVVNGSGRGVSGVSVAGSDATLTLSSAVSDGDTVTVAYSGSAVVDAAGNAAATFSAQGVTNTTSSQDPNVPSLVSPANAAYVSTATPTLTATFSDPDTNNTGKVNFRVCSDSGCSTILATFSSASGTANGADGSAAVPGGAGLASGSTYHWQAQNEDQGARTSAFSASRSFTVDTGAPSSSATFPAAAAYNTAGWTGSLAGTASDPVSGVAAVDISLQRVSTGLWWDPAANAGLGGFTNLTELYFSATGTTSWSYAFASSKFPDDGSYTLHARATDGVGNVQGSPATVTFTYDTTAPAVSSRTVNGATLSVAYGESVSGAPATSDYTVVVNGSGRSVSGVSVSGTAATLTLASAVLNGDVVTVAYSGSAVVDAAGNAAATFGASAVTNSTPNQSPSTPALVTPGNAAYVTTTTPTLTATFSDPDTNNTGQLGFRACSDSGCGIVLSSFSSASGLANGANGSAAVPGGTGLTSGTTYYWQAQAIDENTGTSAFSASRSFTVDTVAPGSSVTFPADGGFYNAAAWTGTLAGSASDATSGVAAVELRIQRASDSQYWNGSGWQSGSTFVSASGTASWSYGLAAAQLASGTSYTVSARATDAAGNVQGSLASATFAYDTAAPNSTLAFPANGTAYNAAGWTGTLTGSASDTGGSGLSVVELRIQRSTDSTYWNGSSWQSGAIFVSATGTTSWSYGLAGANLADGVSYTVSARATDAAGNVQGTLASATFTYDTTAPGTMIGTRPADPSASTTPTFSFTSTESGSTFRCRLDAGLWAACTSPHVVSPALTDASHTFDVEATDAAGNVDATPDTYTWTVDATAPTAVLADPGANLSGTVVLDASGSSDSGSGIASTVFEQKPSSGGSWTPIAAGSWDTMAVADGLYDVRVTVTDNAGNSATATRASRRVDNTAPSLTVTAPADGAYVNSASADPYTVTASADDGAGSGVAWVKFEQCNNTSPSCLPDSWTVLAIDGISPYSASWAIPADGTRVLRATARDNAGRETVQLVTVTVDRTAPAGSLTAPADASNVRGTVALSATASDAAPASGVNTVDFQYRRVGDSTWLLGGSDVTTPYSVNLDTTSLADGLVELRAFVTDVAGNAAASTLLTVRVDNTAPTGAVTAPANAANVRGTIALASDSADSGSGVATVVFERRPAGGGAWTVTASSWNTTLVADGLYDLRVTTTDVAGNSFTSAAIAARVDNTAPTGAVTAPATAANVRGTVSLTSDSADSGSGVATVVFERSPSGAGTWTATPASWNTTLVADGLYDLRVTTTDAAGNSFTSGTITVRVDNTLPTGSVTAPADAAILNGPAVTLTSSSADSGSGVATVVFELSPTGAGTWTAQGSPWNTTSVADGLYDLRVTTTDNAGNVFTSGTITVRVDNTAPVTTASASPGTTSNSTVTVTLSASDGSGSGVSATQYRVDAGGWSAGTTVVITAPGDHSNDGTHTVEFYSTDAVGNVESTKSIAITIDTTGPSGTPGNPGSYLRGTAAALTFTPDTPADVSSVEFQFSPAGMDTWAALGTVLAPGPYTYLWNTTLVTDGDYDLRVRVADSLGNLTTQLLPGLPKRVDNTAPSGAVTAPAASAVVSGTVTLSGFASDAGSGIASLQLQVKPTGAADFSTVATSGSSPISTSWSSASAPDGPADLRVLATDNAGNTVTSAVRTITVDNNAPAVTLADPGAFVAGTVTLSASSSADTTQVVFQRSPPGAGTWTTIGTDASAPFEASLDTTALAAGSYDLRAVATDVGANTGTSGLRTTTVDNVAPAGALTQPTVGRTIGGPSVALAATASDASAGVASVVWQAKPTGAAVFSTVATDTSAPFATTWDATSAADGPAEIRIVVTDAAGNTFTSAPVAVTLDSTAPTVTLADPGALVSGVVALSATTSGAGATQVAFGVSPAGSASWTVFAIDSAAPWAASFDTATLADGLYDLRAVVSDSFGNTNWFVLPGVRFDNTAPALVSSVPADGSVLTSASSVAVTTSEAVTAPGALLDGAAAPAPSASGNMLSFATGSLAEGLHVLSGELQDARGARTPFRVAFTVWTGGSTDVAPVEKTVSSSATTTLTAPENLATVVMQAASWPSVGSTVPGDMLVIRIDPMPSSVFGATIQLGSQVLDVTAYWALAGTPVTQFQAPLDILIPNSTGSLVIPATSGDGVHWRQLALVRTHGVLPDGWADGFYVDGGNVHVLTHHLTYFGLLLDTEPPTPPGGFAGVVADDGLTLRWTPAVDNSGQLGQFILYVNGEPYAQYDNQQFEMKMGPFAADDTRRFTMAQSDAAGNLSPQTASLKALPQLAGLTRAQAEAALAAAGFSVGSVTDAPSAGAPAGTVIAPPGVRLALEGASVDLTVARGSAPTRLVFRVAGAKKLDLAKRRSLAARIEASRPAAVTAILFGPKKQRLYTWKLRVKAGAQIVRLHMPSQIRRPGRYTVSWTARSGTEAIRRTLAMRLLGPRLEQVQPAKQQVEVVLAGEQPDRKEIALGLRGSNTRLVEVTKGPERTFQLAGDGSRNIGVIVVDVDVYGLGFLRDLRVVFPEMRLLALSSSPVNLGRAVQAGANLAVPRSTPADELALIIAKLARQGS